VPKPARVSDHENSSAKSEHKQRDRSLSGASLESVAPKTLRQFDPAERLRLLKAADAAIASGGRPTAARAGRERAEEANSCTHER
jgi:hypothetical protein